MLKRYPIKSHQKVRTIALDGEGNIWAGTTDGILIMNFKNGKFDVKELESPKDESKGLASTDIVCLACDRHGTMWVGSNSGGLSRTTTKDAEGAWQFETFGVEQGLPSEEISSITFDNKGNVWFSTDHILCSFDIKKNIFTTFSNLDGVDDTMCSEGAAVALPNGNILFGTINGYYIVDRSKLMAEKGSLLKLQITDFFIDGELQSPRFNDNYDFYVPTARRIKLPSHSSGFGFRFAAMNYALQHRVHYQYMLEGYDKDWHNAGKDRLATYDDLSAGTYTFKVKAFLLESPDKFDLRTVEIEVPAFSGMTQTNLLWVVFGAIAVVTLFMWFRKRGKK